jgi:hypothetical protein
VNLYLRPGAKNTKAVSIARTPKDSVRRLIVPARKNTTSPGKWKWFVKTAACAKHTAISMRSRKARKIQMATLVAGLANTPKVPKQAKMAGKCVIVCPTKA